MDEGTCGTHRQDERGELLLDAQLSVQPGTGLPVVPQRRCEQRWHVHLEHHLSSVPRARHWVLAHCAGLRVPTPRASVVELLTAELTANAVLHGSPRLRLELRHAHGEVRVAVEDGSPVEPVRRTVGPDATGGRGVALVDLLSDEWGVQRGADGKTVWFLLRAPA